MAGAVVLLHGFAQTGASWAPVVAALDESYRARALDLRGHGAASARRPVDLDGVLRDVDAAARETCLLVGYSMGGRIALHAALARPGRFTGLVLVGASPGIADEGERAARAAADELLAGEIERGSIEAFAERWEAQPVFAGRPPAVAAAARRDRLRNTPAGLAAALRGLGTGTLPSLWQRLGELAVPAVLVVGERDEKFRAVADAMTDRLPDARLVVVPRAGHAAHLEDPGAVAAVIAAAA